MKSPKTSLEIKEKWQLATEGDISHIICMPNVDKIQIDEFISNIKHSIVNTTLEEDIYEFEY